MKHSMIRVAGDDILSRQAEPVADSQSQEIRELVDRLFKVMYDTNGAGLAAPQIGISKRVIVYGITHNPRYPDVKPISNTALINPKILWSSKAESDYYEGCLSLPNLRGLVSRPKLILFSAYALNGEKILRVARDFEARVIQHEIDHLDGLLFPSRMTDMKTLKYSSL